MTSVEHQPTAEEVMACLDGELPPEATAAIQLHAQGCAICRQVMDDLRETSSDLARWQVNDPPASLRAPSPVARTSSRWTWAFRWKPLVAAAAVGGLALITLLPSTASKPPRVFAVNVPEATLVKDAEVGRLGAQRGAGGGRVAPARAEPARSASAVAGRPPAAGPVAGQTAEGPMIARWATLRIVAARFDDVRPSLDRILRDVKGFAGRLDQTAERGATRSLNATLRVPAASLDAALGSLKQLGHVVAESQGGDDVTEQVVDLAARLSNARHTESRLTDVLRNRTGKVADVLEAEREIARVREEIERLDAERTTLDRRVVFATITLDVSEERKAELDMGPQPVSAQIRNALVDGFRSAAESTLNATLAVLRVAPTMTLWIVVLAWPARITWRRIQQFRVAHGAGPQ